MESGGAGHLCEVRFAVDCNTTATGDCGNGAVDPGEQCDGSELGERPTCADHGLVDGTLACRSCAYDLSGCESPPAEDCSTEVPGLEPIAVIMGCVGGAIGGCAVAYKASGSTGEHFAFFVPNGCTATPFVLAGLSNRQEMGCSDAGCILLHNGTNLEMSSITPSGTSPLMDLGVPSDPVLGIAPAFVDGEFRFYLAFSNSGDVHRMNRNGAIEQSWAGSTPFGTLSQERFFAFDDVLTDRLVTSAVGFSGTMRPYTLVQWTLDGDAMTKTEYVVGMFRTSMAPVWDVSDTTDGRVRSWLQQDGTNVIEVATMATDLSGPENESTIMVVGGTLEDYKVVRVRDGGTVLIGRVDDGAGNISIRIFRLGDDIPAMLDVSMGDVIVEEDVAILEAAAGNDLIGVYLWGATANVHQIVY